MIKFSRSLCGKFYEITAVSVGLCSVGILIILNIFYLINLNRKTVENLRNEISYISINMSEQLEKYETTVYSNYGVKRLYNVVKDKVKYTSKIKYYDDLEDVFISNYFLHDGLLGLAYFDEDDDMVSMGRISNNEACECYKVYKEMEIKQPGSIWLSLIVDSAPYYLCYMNIEFLNDDYKAEPLGTVILFIDVYKLSNQISIHSESACDFVVVDVNNKVAISNVKHYLHRDFGTDFKKTKSGCISIDDNKNYITYENISSDYNYKIVGLYAKSNLYWHLCMFLGISLLIAFPVCFVTAIVLYYLSKKISEPITNLSKYMQTVDFDEPNEIDKVEDKQYYEELDIIYSSFNKMLDKLNVQIVENYNVNIKFKDAYIQALERQINPHFIYNTLQMLQMAAITQDKYQVFDLVGAFGEIIRFNLDRENIVYVADEIGNIENYFRILKMRFGDKLEYYMDISNEIMNCYIAKFVFQPIIENAFFHGIEELNGIGKIMIIAKIIKDEVVFIVKDNGVGMDSETLREIRSTIIGEKKTTSIGLYNVNERIKLLYGNDYGIWIYSKKGEGTSVMIHFPVQRDGFEDNNVKGG